jgi:N-acetyl-anhydromuramyl-L-alanine amidase AmpD
MTTLRRCLVVLGALALVGGCVDGPTVPRLPRLPAQELDALFARAGREFGVQEELLKAVGWVETRWQMVRGEEEFPGQAPAFGIMALRGEGLERGARLARVSAESARSEPAANLRAAAALLSALADEAGVQRGDLGSWAPAVARYSGLAAGAAQSAYVHDGVYATLARGVTVRAPDGRVLGAIAPTPARPVRVPPPGPRPAAAPDYPVAGTMWRPSPWHTARPADATGKVHMVVVHTCESSYAVCWGWLTDPANSAQTSAHYVVKEDGAEVSQLVAEARRAHHIAASYDCTRNGGHDCALNGVQSNHFTIGIEHAGYASQSAFPAAQLDASARLACDVSRDRGIPRDRFHFVGHGQLQPYNRTDPGPAWPWTDYLARADAHCGAAAVTIDSNNANNDAARGYLSVSANWTASAATAGYYGSGYYFANTAAVSDAATFWFHLPVGGTRTVEAWWTAGSNRAAAAPFIAYNAAGAEIGRASVDQRVNGARWNAVGSWAFTAGWNRVVVSRWTTPGAVVVADAIRVR